MDLNTFGWDDEWASALAASTRPDIHPARVIAAHRGRVVLHDRRSVPVLTDEVVVVGDWVGVRDDAVRVVLPRRTTLEREGSVLVANADLALAVTSLNADLNVRRIERLTALARAGGVEPLVVLNKGDLSPDPLAEAERMRDRVGGDVIVLSAQDGWGVSALRARLQPRRTAVLLGMSGVGKSTLVNLLLGEEVQRTLTVRASDDRGRHATTHRELFVLDDGALLIDTPGVRRPGLADAAGVTETFADIAELAQACRFADCRHDTEPGCAVRDAVDPDRLASMRKLEQEGATAAERRATGRRRAAPSAATTASTTAGERRGARIRFCDAGVTPSVASPSQNGSDQRFKRATSGTTTRWTAGGGEVMTVSSRKRCASPAIQTAPRRLVGRLRRL